MTGSTTSEDHPNAQRALAYLQAIGAGDLERAAERFAQRIVWRVAGGHELGGSYRGKAEVVGYLRSVLDRAGGTLALTPESILASDDHVAMIVRVAVTIDGTSYDTDLAQIVTVGDDGRWTEYWSLPIAPPAPPASPKDSAGSSGAGVDEATFVAAVLQTNLGSFEAWQALWADDAVWHVGGDNPYAGSFHGPEEITNWFRRTVTHGFEVMPLEILTDGRHFVFFIRIHGEVDGLHLHQVHANAWRVRGDKFVEGWFLPDDQDALDEYLRAHHAAHET